MKCSTYIILLSITFILLSCNDDNQVLGNKKSKPNKIVLISLNAPENNSFHLLKQDSIGKKVTDSLGPRAILTNNGFEYLDHMYNVQIWNPKPNISDTIIIECHDEYLELSTTNFFTSIKETFLIKNGDTVVINYEYKIPSAKILNRDVNDLELNYNRFRLKKIFNNKYSSHHLVFGNMFLNDNFNEFEEKSVKFYKEARNDYLREIELLDSLLNSNAISKINYDYRKDALKMVMEKHKKIKPVKKFLEQEKSLNSKEIIEKTFGFDLTKTDSLMKFSFFREYLSNISNYDLKFITENNGNSGGSYVDSRIRFDSILEDKRFNQTAKNFLLFSAYKGIGQNFKIKDKEVYFKKLQEHTSNIEQLNKLVNDYNIDFSKSEKLVLTSLENDTLTFSTVLKNNKGKWLYIDFWASWCKPCRTTMPKSRKLKKELKEDNIEFIYLSLNDKKENWKRAIEMDSISDSQNYFVENGNLSKVIEDLGIKTIPHYLIYNPNGELVNGFANRPGEGAKEQIKKLMTE